MVVERELARTGNVSRREMGREAFVAKVWEWKEQSGGTILEQSRRLGDSFDLSRNRFTMDEGFHDAVLKVFVDFYDRGLIYRGKRLVNWDPHFETAISDLEVEQVEAEGPPLAPALPARGRRDLPAPDRLDEDGTPHRLRDPRLPRRRHHPPRDHARRHRRRRPPRRPPLRPPRRQDRPPAAGRPLHPDRRRRLRRPGEGTGAVKITPAHDFNDWDVGQRHGLAAINVMDTRARIALSDERRPSRTGIDPDEELADLDGLDRYEARDVVLTLAEEQGWLDGVDPETHTVPHGDRSKVAIEPFLTDQWYVDAATLAKPALAAVRDGRTRILPERDEKTYFHWLENIEPWCISRQLWWGHQIPVWYGPTFGRRPLRHRRGSSAPSERRSTALAQQYYGARSTKCVARGTRDGRRSTARARRFATIGVGRAGGTSDVTIVTFGATPTSSTPGSPPASGRSAPSAGPRTPPSSAATTRPPSSSPASTSSSSGSPG